MPNLEAQSKRFDFYWKILTGVIGMFIIPLVGWVWNVNVAVAQLENDLGDAEAAIENLDVQVSEADENSKAIISIEKDIEYMKTALGRIEDLVSRRKDQ